MQDVPDRVRAAAEATVALSHLSECRCEVCGRVRERNQMPEPVRELPDLETLLAWLGELRERAGAASCTLPKCAETNDETLFDYCIHDEVRDVTYSQLSTIAPMLAKHVATLGQGVVRQGGHRAPCGQHNCRLTNPAAENLCAACQVRDALDALRADLAAAKEDADG